MQFENSAAFVTGATGNIGQSICEKLAAQGVAIAATDLDQTKCDAFAEALRAAGAQAIGCQCDVTDASSVENAVRKTLAAFGKIDILVNNAGRWVHPGHFQTHLADTPKELWLPVLETNLVGVFHVTQAVLPTMLENGYGRIVNLGSIAGEVGLPSHADYAAAKGGVIALTKTLAMEYAAKNITVNCVSPGMVSPVPGQTQPNPGTWLGRSGERGEIADAILFLASDDAGYITGVDLPVDGGRTVGPHNCNFTF